MIRNIMVKTIPLNAKPTLKLDAKNEAKVKATKQRLARSSNFSAYNLRWNSFSSILNDSIIGNLFCQELCSKTAIARSLQSVIARRAKGFLARHCEADEVSRSNLYRRARNRLCNPEGCDHEQSEVGSNLNKDCFAPASPSSRSRSQ